MKKNKATEIKIAIIRAGTSQAQIARDLGVKIASVNQVIQGRGQSKRVADYIEKVTGIRPVPAWERDKKAA